MSGLVQTAMIELDVAVLGGGFAGVNCARVLRAKNKDLRIGLISAENHMVFQPMLAEVAGASLSPRHVVNPIRQLCKGVTVFKGNVTDIEPERKILHVDAGDFSKNVPIQFKNLVVCLGARIDLSRVPGMPEHALLMQNVGDAMKLRATIIGRFEEANLVEDPEIRSRLLTFVVVGGGYSGVETAGELLDLFSAINRYYSNVSAEDFSVYLIHSRSYLLPTMPQHLGEYARRKLEKRGMKIILNQRVKAMTANTVILDDGRRISTSTVVSTVGNAPHPVVVNLAAAMELETVEGRLKTTPELRVDGIDWLWAAGDCAAVPKGGGDGSICPPTAQFAMRQGTMLGRNLAEYLRSHDAKLKPFTFKGLGELAAIGHQTAVAEILGLRFSGFFAWWMWRTIYLSKLPGLQRKLRVMFDWTLDLFFPRDINLLNPRFTRPLRLVHLEPGDVLFNPGEPAFSLYFVKTGQIEIRDGEHVIKRVMAGDYFGERALLEDKEWHYQARAVEATHLISLGSDEFAEIVSGSRALMSLFKRSAQAYQKDDDVQRLRDRLHERTLQGPASDIMNRAMDTILEDATVAEVLELFRKKYHGSYPVVTAEGLPKGVVKRDSLFDFIKRGESGTDHRVTELGISELPVLPETRTGEDLLDAFLRGGRNKVLLVDDNGKLTGLATLLDLLEHSLRQEAADKEADGVS